MLPQWEAQRKEDHWGHSTLVAPHAIMRSVVTKQKGRQHLHYLKCPDYIYIYVPLPAKLLICKLNAFMRSLPKRTTTKSHRLHFLYFKGTLDTEEEQDILSSWSPHQHENWLSSWLGLFSHIKKQKPSCELPKHPSHPASPFLLPPIGFRGKRVPIVKPDLLPDTLDPTADNTFLHLYPLSLYRFFNFTLLLVPSPKYKLKFT